MKSGYKCSAKRIAAIGVMLCMLVLTCLTVTSVLNTKAEESIGQGHVCLLYTSPSPRDCS